MFLPIRRNLRKIDIFFALLAGVGVTFYTWTPFLREQALKSKQIQSSENSQQQSGESQLKTTDQK